MQMYASYPLSKPISILLDYVLGHDEGVTYKRAGLKTFVSLHRHLGAENLLDDEVTIISSVLELSEKSIRDIMVPVDDIYSLSSEQVLDEDTVTEVSTRRMRPCANVLLRKHSQLNRDYVHTPCRSFGRATPEFPSTRPKTSQTSSACCSLRT